MKNLKINLMKYLINLPSYVHIFIGNNDYVTKSAIKYLSS
tara:strand:- start:127 stop:246 length:120 start_codon:yes stop_codon:yes gene_type:complete